MTSFRLKILAAAALFAGAVAFTGPPAFAVDGVGAFPLDLFELDGNPQDPGGAGLPDDWETLFNDCDPLVDPTICGNADVFTGILADPADPDDSSIFTGGGSKDINDVSVPGETSNAWLHESGSTPDKNDITNAFAAAYVNDTEVCVNPAEVVAGCPGSGILHAVGDLIVYFGADRFDNSGDAFLGFWFFQDDITLTNDPLKGGFEFDGNHVPGDLLVLVEYPQGANAMPEIKVLEWDPTVVKADADFAAENLRLLITAADALCDGTGGKLACAITNDVSVPSVWPYTPKGGMLGDPYPFETFYSGGVNVSQLTGTSLCISSFLAETRSSRSETAQLKDFVLGEFETCAVGAVTTIHEGQKTDGTPHTVIALNSSTTLAGTVAHDSVIITGSNLAGVSPDPSGTVTFTLHNGLVCGGTPLLTDPVLLSVGNGDGTADAESASFTFNTSGDFSWTATWPGDTNYPDGATAACEPFSVVKLDSKVRTEIHEAGSHTDIQNGTKKIGIQIHDFAEVKELNDDTTVADPTGTVRFEFFLNGTCSTPVSQTLDRTIGSDGTANGTATVETLDLTPPVGEVSFKATYLGDSLYNASTESGCEKLTVEKFESKIRTEIHLGTNHGTDVQDGVGSGVVKVGTTFHDFAEVAEKFDLVTAPDPTGNVTFTLYNGGVCSGTPVESEAKALLDSSENGNATVEWKDHTLAAGVYSYSATYGGDPNYAPPAAAASCEKITVEKYLPAVTSSILVRDLAQVFAAAGGPDPTGTVDFKLYSDTTCTSLISTQAGVSLDASQEALSTQLTISAVGTTPRSWQVTYNGDASNLAVTHACESISIVLPAQTN